MPATDYQRLVFEITGTLTSKLVAALKGFQTLRSRLYAPVPAEYGGSLKAATAQHAKLQRSLLDVGVALKKTGGYTRSEAKAVETYRKKVSGATTSLLSLRDKTLKLRTAQIKLGKAGKQLTPALKKARLEEAKQSQVIARLNRRLVGAQKRTKLWGQRTKELTKTQKALTKQVGDLGEVVQKAGLPLLLVAAIAKTVALGFALAMGVAIKAAMKFEYAMAEVATILDSQFIPLLGALRSDILGLSMTFGIASDNVAKAMYHILSAQIPVSGATKVLTASMRAARAGFVDATTAADAITTVLKSYQLSTAEAARVSDLLFGIVKKGKIEFRGLAPQIGRVAATAASAGMQLEELAAVFAVVTGAGMRAGISATSIGAILRDFLRPTVDAQQLAWHEWGIQLDETHLKGEGLIKLLKQLRTASMHQLAVIFPQIRGYRAIAALKMRLGDLTKTYAYMLDAEGATTEALSLVQDTLKMQLDRVGAGFSANIVHIGTMIESELHLKSVTEVLADALQALAEQLDKLNVPLGRSAVTAATLAAEGGLLAVVFTAIKGVFTGATIGAKVLAVVFAKVAVAILAIYAAIKILSEVLDYHTYGPEKRAIEGTKKLRAEIEALDQSVAVMVSNYQTMDKATQRGSKGFKVLSRIIAELNKAGLAAPPIELLAADPLKVVNALYEQRIKLIERQIRQEKTLATLMSEQARVFEVPGYAPIIIGVGESEKLWALQKELKRLRKMAEGFKKEWAEAVAPWDAMNAAVKTLNVLLHGTREEVEGLMEARKRDTKEVMTALVTYIGFHKSYLDGLAKRGDLEAKINAQLLKDEMSHVRLLVEMGEVRGKLLLFGLEKEAGLLVDVILPALVAQTKETSKRLVYMEKIADRTKLERLYLEAVGVAQDRYSRVAEAILATMEASGKFTKAELRGYKGRVRYTTALQKLHKEYHTALAKVDELQRKMKVAQGAELQRLEKMLELEEYRAKTAAMLYILTKKMAEEGAKAAEKFKEFEVAQLGFAERQAMMRGALRVPAARVTWGGEGPEGATEKTAVLTLEELRKLVELGEEQLKEGRQPAMAG